MDENIFYPELTLETDDIIMELTIKKDYSKIRDSDKRKEEFIKRWKELEVICEDELILEYLYWYWAYSLIQENNCKFHHSVPWY